MARLPFTVELGANDEPRVNVIRHNLFFHLEMLANKIDGPMKWDAGGIATLLVDMEKCYTKVNEDLKGNWFSVFVEFGVRGKQMLLTSSTIWRMSHHVNQFILLMNISNRFQILACTCRS